MVSSLSTRAPKSFSAKLISSWWVPSPAFCMELFLPRYRTLHFPLLNLMSFFSGNFSSLSRTLWMAAQPCGVLFTPLWFASSWNLLRVQYAPSSKPLMKILNSSGPSIFLGVHCWWQSSTWNSCHWSQIFGSSASFSLPDSIHLTHLALWGCYGRQHQKPCYSPDKQYSMLSLTHWASHLIVEDY